MRTEQIAFNLDEIGWKGDFSGWKSFSFFPNSLEIPVWWDKEGRKKRKEMEDVLYAEKFFSEKIFSDFFPFWLGNFLYFFHIKHDAIRRYEEEWNPNIFL